MLFNNWTIYLWSMWYFITEDRSTLQSIKVPSIIMRISPNREKCEDLCYRMSSMNSLVIIDRMCGCVNDSIGYFLISIILHLDEGHYRIIGKRISARVSSKKFHWLKGSNWQNDFPFSIFMLKVSFMAWRSQPIVWWTGSMCDWNCSSKGWKRIYHSGEWLYDAIDRRRSRNWSSTNCWFNFT